MIKKIESEDSDDDSSDDRKIPIDEFGAAFLRGLGWQEEKRTRMTANPLTLKIYLIGNMESP